MMILQLGPCTKDVSKEGGGGYPRPDQRKEGCVDLKGGGSQKFPIIELTSYVNGPLFSCVLSVCSILLPSA